MKKNALVLAAIIALTVLVIASYNVYETHITRMRVIALLKDSNERLSGALRTQVTDKPDEKVEASVSSAERDVVVLREMETSSLRRLADAADDALVTSREIVRRHADMRNARGRLAHHVEAFARHIQSDRGRSDWTRGAVRLKELVDKDLRDYRIAVESYAALLDLLPESQAKLTAYLDPDLLIDQKRAREARKHALDAYASTEQNIKRVGSVQGYRVGETSARRR